MDELSNFEVVQIFYMAREAASGDMSFLVTILSAYLVAVFLAAKRLSRFQILTITAIYTATFFYTSLGYYFAYSAVLSAGEQLSGQPIPAWSNGIIAVIFVAWLVSIVFMVHARREGDT